MSEDPQWPRASAWLKEGGSTQAGAPLLVVLGAPLAQASISASRADTTPAAVRAALRRYSTLAAWAGGVTVDVGDVRVVDLGDLEIAELENEDAQQVVAAAVAEVWAGPDLDADPDLLVVLGGDNAITRPAARASAGDLSTMGLLTIDAHHDVRGFHAGPSNGTPVRGLLEDGLAGANVVQVGIGTFTNAPAHRAYCDEQGVTVITAAEARAAGVAAVVAEQLDRLARSCDRLYVDLDVDVLDAVFAPGCPGARPGGLAPWELVEAAYAAGRHPKVVGVDIVEVDAQADVGGLTVDVSAQCLLAVAAGLAARRHRPPD